MVYLTFLVFCRTKKIFIEHQTFVREYQLSDFEVWIRIFGGWNLIRLKNRKGAVCCATVSNPILQI